MKRFFSLLILSVFVWQFVGYFAYFQWERFSIKKEIKSKLKHKLDDDQLVTLHLSKADFQNLSWYEESEFEFGDQMYDVVSIQSTSKGFVIKCINDDRESELFAGLGKKVDDELSKSKTGKTFSLFLKIFQLESTEWEQLVCEQAPNFDETSSSYFRYQALNSQQAYSKNIQPPRFF